MNPFVWDGVLQDEMEQADYLALKRKDYQRQQAGPLASELISGPSRS